MVANLDTEWIYRGSSHVVADEVRANWLNHPPPWRKRVVAQPLKRSVAFPLTVQQRGERYVTASPDEVLRINIALLLRRPLLVTGEPGVGKTTLAYNIAYCLNLGPPLRWEIGSNTTLLNGLYAYDAVGHFNATRLSQSGEPAPIGDYITLGPLGTALLPTEVPRVLLIDELDKASFDLPNDLLHVFEEGSFTIPELSRTPRPMCVRPADEQDEQGNDRIEITQGVIATLHHPIVVITSNGEREFPEAFLRRCVQLELRRPQSEEVLHEIVRRQFGDEIVDKELVSQAISSLSSQSTDVLIQAIFLRNAAQVSFDDSKEVLKRERGG